jgi:hypothetical protein
MRHETPEGCEVDDDAVVQVWVPERRNTGYFFAKDPQFLNKGFLLGDLLTLTCCGVWAGCLYKARMRSSC